MTDNEKRFREVYAVKLAEAIVRRPADYFYGPEGIPAVIDKMVPSLAQGGANVGPAIKATARALGIKSTIGAIKEFLSS